MAMRWLSVKGLFMGCPYVADEDIGHIGVCLLMGSRSVTLAVDQILDVLCPGTTPTAGKSIKWFVSVDHGSLCAWSLGGIQPHSLANGKKEIYLLTRGQRV